ncbi:MULTISPECIES: nucleotidyl transferase AbiEii/AbiGii toxin family protein [unclassified Solwaraspora]|uniref:nucleotidyl transferase AbiEii/AbiGii toxin family protein n=1 Tax=unclassified Solwaraspora TaxID=2627926 RepID=UPI00248CA11E|nr:MULTISPECIES: nucleotidyl transferase AbiEii/AbiGii toxin family protein [unclassified Solwaraspora]WBB98136.1 nucleotidyl transferase AbiEii/AbiGii toxin family protein [Solwaraspora sp. WMMA2059]WBC23309.1 nucleotidyl transferase AbiEii/AbiGii toxin family protein [Solwaraspora sp. WMMA2080]WJK34608.1 nucleotidyl transferase AbiEii/AbiGii toxin family protein [Solwaraspora sp. WMMA2065]
MPHETHPLHRQLAEIGLRAGGPFGFALAGGHAVAAHGILDRPSEDVDLFSDWQRRADFPQAVDVLIAAYEAEGFNVTVDLRLDTFARLHISHGDAPGEQHRVELVANWRAQPPVEMQIGPVLHPDDVMAGKMDALYNRAAARDFLDIDAAVTRGRYTHDELCALATAADAGFDQQLFAQMLGSIARFDDQDFIDYGLDANDVAALRDRFSAWQARIRAQLSGAAPRSEREDDR